MPVQLLTKDKIHENIFEDKVIFDKEYTPIGTAVTALLTGIAKGNYNEKGNYIGNAIIASVSEFSVTIITSGIDKTEKEVVSIDDITSSKAKIVYAFSENDIALTKRKVFKTSAFKKGTLICFEETIPNSPYFMVENADILSLSLTGVESTGEIIQKTVIVEDIISDDIKISSTISFG